MQPHSGGGGRPAPALTRFAVTYPWAVLSAWIAIVAVLGVVVEWLAFRRLRGASEDAMFVSAGLGMVMANNSTISGASPAPAWRGSHPLTRTPRGRLSPPARKSGGALLPPNRPRGQRAVVEVGNRGTRIVTFARRLHGSAARSGSPRAGQGFAYVPPLSEPRSSRRAARWRVRTPDLYARTVRL